ncbi:LuxR C-terminal-related transcriptional regulator [Actinomadura chokoriensis]|uniref:LuxR C-terminal-related transcriptional regulator n=1 Tax=Actinomadura chokoriensis TaxID=454156 RepID=UPI003568CC4E
MASAVWVLGELARGGVPGTHGIRTVVLTTFDMDEYVDEALTLGAGGFLLKSSSYEELLIAVRAAAGGDGALSPSVARRVIGGYVAHRRSQRVDAADSGRLCELTPRERDVLRLIGQGLSNSEIAAGLVLSEHAVHNPCSRIPAKLGLRSRGQAVAFTRRVSLYPYGGQGTSGEEGDQLWRCHAGVPRRRAGTVVRLQAASDRILLVAFGTGLH